MQRVLLFPIRIRWKFFVFLRVKENEEIKPFFTRLRHSNGCRPLFTHIHRYANKSCHEAVICTAPAPVAASRKSEKMTTTTTTKMATTIVRRMTHGIMGKVVKCDNNDAMDDNRLWEKSAPFGEKLISHVI